MVTYEEQLAKIAQTEEFLQRQIELSDDNVSDVLEALINNPDNVFFVNGEQVSREETSINLEQYLIEQGINPDDIPLIVSRDIFDPVKQTDLREQLAAVDANQTFETNKVTDTLNFNTFTVLQQANEIVINDPLFIEQLPSIKQQVPFVLAPLQIPTQVKDSGTGLFLLIGLAALAGGF